MENPEKNYEPKIEKITKIWTPDAKLEIPYKNKKVTFAFPSFGPDTYLNVKKQILENNLLIPTAEQTATLLYATYLSKLKDNPEFQKVREIMKKKWLLVFNRNIWINKGVYVVQDSETKIRSEELKISNLEEELKNSEEINGVKFSKDGKVRFAPKNSYTLEEHRPDSLAENGFVIANYGKQGAKKLAELSIQPLSKPYIYGLNIQKGNDSRVSAVDGFEGKLHIFGDFYEEWDGYAFGVLK